MNYRIPHLALLLVLLVLTVGCGRDDRSSDARTDVFDSTHSPDSEASGVLVHLYERGQVTALIKADKFLKFSTNDSTMAYHVDADSFDSLGNVKTQVSGDSAIIRETDGFLMIFGNVIVISDDGRRLETDYLNWNSQTDRIYTDAFVRITTPEETVRGWGMEADQQIRRYKILHRVSGEVEDASRLQDAPSSFQENATPDPPSESDQSTPTPETDWPAEPDPSADSASSPE